MLLDLTVGWYLTACAVSKELSVLTINVRQTVEKIQELRLNHHEQEILDWLSAPNPSVNYENALEKRHKGTGKWFIDGRAFADWKKQPNSFLWLHGLPGCGKTVLSSTIIEHLRNSAKSAHVPLYFYFDFTDTHKQTFEDMLRSLVRQLYRGQPDSRRPLEKLRESPNESNRQLSKTSLKGVFLAMLSEVDNVSIVLDALDESTTRSELLAWLQGILKAGSCECRVLVTARREQDIESAFQCWTRSEDRISIRGNEVDRDIRSYVRHTVCNSKGLSKWRKMPEVLREIGTELMNRADGM